MWVRVCVCGCVCVWNVRRQLQGFKAAMLDALDDMCRGHQSHTMPALCELATRDVWCTRCWTRDIGRGWKRAFGVAKRPREISSAQARRQEAYFFSKKGKNQEKHSLWVWIPLLTIMNFLYDCVIYLCLSRCNSVYMCVSLGVFFFSCFFFTISVSFVGVIICAVVSSSFWRLG